MSSTPDRSLFPARVTFTAKTSNRLLGKATGQLVLPPATATDPSPAPIGVHLEFDIEVIEGEPYWFDITTPTPELGGLLITDVEVDGSDVDYEVHWPRLLSGDEEMDAYPQPYRGWGYAGFNGDGVRAGLAMNEDAFVLETSEFPEKADEAPTDFEEKDTDYKNPLKGNGYPYVPNPESNRWQGPKAPAQTDDQDLSARPNIRGVTYGAAGGSSPSRLGPDSVGNPAGPATTDRAPTLKGRAQQDTVGGNLGAGLGGIGAGVSWGTSSARNGFVDLNGDAYPDVIGGASRGPVHQRGRRPPSGAGEHRLRLGEQQPAVRGQPPGPGRGAVDRRQDLHPDRHPDLGARERWREPGVRRRRRPRRGQPHRRLQRRLDLEGRRRRNRPRRPQRRLPSRSHPGHRRRALRPVEPRVLLHERVQVPRRRRVQREPERHLFRRCDRRLQPRPLRLRRRRVDPERRAAR